MSWTETPNPGVLDVPDQPTPASGVLPGFGVSPQPSQAQAQPRPVIPATLTQPPVPQRFVPNYAAPYKEWGKPNWAIKASMDGVELGHTTHMPNADEAFHVAAGSATQLSQWGPGKLAPQYNALAMVARALGSTMDYFSKGAFWKNFNSSQARVYEAQRQQFEMQREQFFDQGMQTVAAHNDMMEKYGKAFAEYDSYRDKNGNYPEEAKKLFKDEMRGLLSNDGHGHLLHYLDNDDIDGLRRALEAEHAKLLDKWSSLVAIGNMRTGGRGTVKEASDLDKAIAGENLGTGGGLLGSPAGGYREPSKLDPESLTAAFDSELKEKYAPFSDTGIAMARDKVNGSGLSDAQLRLQAPKEGTKIAAAAEDIRRRAQQIENSSQETAAKIEALKHINPTEANAVESLMDYSSDPKGPDKKYVDAAIAVSNNTYKPVVYPYVQDFLKRRDVHLMSIRGSSLGRTELNFLQAVKPIPENTSIPFNAVEYGESIYVTGDQKYTTLYQTVNDLVYDAAGLIQGAGTPRVTTIQNLLKHLSPTMSPAQLRGAIQALVSTANSAEEAVNAEWQRTTGKSSDYPGYDAAASAIHRGVVLMDPLTQHIPDDIGDGKGGTMPTPNSLKAVSKTPPPMGSNLRPPHARNAPPPFSQSQINAIKEMIRTGDPNDPKIKKLIEELGINQ